MTAPGSRSPRLVVERPPQGIVAKARRFRLLVDAEEVGYLRPGETISRGVGRGEHRVQVRIDWTGSPECHVFVGEEDVILTVTVRGNVLSRTRYLELVEGSIKPAGGSKWGPFVRQTATSLVPMLVLLVLVGVAVGLLG